MHNVIHILRGILLKPLNDLYIFPKFDPRSNDRYQSTNYTVATVVAVKMLCNHFRYTKIYR